MFHFHKWKKIRSGVCVAQHTSILFKKDWTEDVTVIVEQCSKCFERRAYMVDMVGKKQKITIEYANKILGHIPYNPF